MVSEARKQSMAWMETDYSKHTYFRWKIKWRLEHLGALEIVGETAPFIYLFISSFPFVSPFLTSSSPSFLKVFPAFSSLHFSEVLKMLFPQALNLQTGHHRK